MLKCVKDSKAKHDWLPYQQDEICSLYIKHAITKEITRKEMEEGIRAICPCLANKAMESYRQANEKAFKAVDTKTKAEGSKYHPSEAHEQAMHRMYVKYNLGKPTPPTIRKKK